MKYKFKIKGLDCANCAAELERAIQKIDGVDEATISFMTEKLVIECEEENKEEVMKKVEELHPPVENAEKKKIIFLRQKHDIVLPDVERTFLNMLQRQKIGIDAPHVASAFHF